MVRRSTLGQKSYLKWDTLDSLIGLLTHRQFHLLADLADQIVKFNAKTVPDLARVNAFIFSSALVKANRWPRPDGETEEILDMFTSDQCAAIDYAIDLILNSKDSEIITLTWFSIGNMELPADASSVSDIPQAKNPDIFLLSCSRPTRGYTIFALKHDKYLYIRKKYGIKQLSDIEGMSIGKAVSFADGRLTVTDRLYKLLAFEPCMYKRVNVSESKGETNEEELEQESES
jgi:hypothetical protein